MVFNLDATTVEAPTLETPAPAQAPAVGATGKVKAPLVEIDREVFRSESHLLSFQGYIGNNFKIEQKADGTTGETRKRKVINKETKQEEVVEVPVNNFVPRPQSVGFAIKNEGAENVVYFVDKYLSNKGTTSLITERRFDELETRELAIGETAYLTKYALGILVGEDRFGSAIGGGIIIPELAQKAKEENVDFDAEGTLLSVNVRGGESADSLHKTNISLSVINAVRPEAGAKRISVPVTRFPVHIATEVGSQADGFPALEGATVKAEFAESFSALAEKATKAGRRTKSGSAGVNDSARRLAHLNKLYAPKAQGK